MTSQLLGVVSESLSNVIRHARASMASVELGHVGDSSGGWRLSISDNGVGFEPAAVTRLGHQGLANMRERVAEIDGHLSIVGRRGAGTRIVIDVPAEVGRRAWPQ